MTYALCTLPVERKLDGDYRDLIANPPNEGLGCVVCSPPGYTVAGKFSGIIMEAKRRPGNARATRCNGACVFWFVLVITAPFNS